MSKFVDKLCVYFALFSVMLTPVATWAVLNVSQRPDTITVAVELPKPKPVVAIYEYGPDEEIPAPETGDDWYDDYEPYIMDIEEEQYSYNEHDLKCMALNIYFEARDESLKGQIAVGLVTLNRVDSPYFPNNVCDVVYQHMQFSWYWDGKSDRPIYLEKYRTALLLASALLDHNSIITDYTYGSDHYHADYVSPEWRLAMVKIVQIDTHIFYRYDNRIY